LWVVSEVVERYRWVVHAYCLMSNHYHLLIETPQANLSAGMRQVNGVYTQRFNRRYKREGYLFQGRYKACLVEKEAYLLELSRYIVLNPVRAGMVGRLEEWPWSSYNATAGMQKKVSLLHIDFILEQFSSDKRRERRLYRSFVKGGLAKESPLRQARGGLLLGGEEFIGKWRGLLEKTRGDEFIWQEKYAARPLLEEIFNGKVRDAGIDEAVNQWGYRLKEVGAFLGLHYSRVSRIASQKAKNKT